jgi:hypothetical protein
MTVKEKNITNVIYVVIFAVVLLTMLPSLIPLASNAAADLFTTLGNNTVSAVGTDAAAFALQMPDLLGWFWILGPIVLVIGIAMGMFKSGRR